MSETLPITNGTTDLESTNSSEPVVNNVKETLPDSSTGNDSECATGTISLTTIEERNGDGVSVVDGGNATDDVDNAAEKFEKKHTIKNDHNADKIQKGDVTTPNATDGADSLSEVPVYLALEKVKRKRKRAVKTCERIVRNMPRRAINETRPKYAPVKRQKRLVEKPEFAIPNGLHELNNSIDYEESKDEASQKIEMDATSSEFHDALLDPLKPSTGILKEGDAKITQLDVSVREHEKEKNLESETDSATKDFTAKTISLSSIKKENSPKKSVLSHFQIMRRVLNKKALYGALLVDEMFECPICHVRKQKAQYLLLHLKGHNDLTQVFERFQAFGDPIDEIEKGASDLPKQVHSQDTFVPKTVNPRLKKFGSRRKKLKPIISEFGIPILPLPEPKIRKKIISKSAPEMQSKPIEIEDVTVPSIASETPVVEPFVDPPLKPSLCSKVRKRKVPLKRIPKRWPAAETYEEPPDDIIVDVKKSRLGVSHMRALGPELLDYLKQVMKQKVTENNPHKCKFCGKMFIKGQGIYAHYFKHSRTMTSPKCKIDDIPENGLSQALRNRDNAFDDLIPISDNEDAESNRDTDFLTLQELETNVNKLLRNLVRDTDVLRNLGWPERRVSDLVIDILERCSLQPAYCSGSRLSQLQCLRKNMGKLFRFCIKEEAMEKYGWDIKLVDIVVREMIAVEACINLNRI